MKTRFFILLFSLLTLNMAARAGTPVNYVSGNKDQQKIKLAYGLVNGTTYFKQSDFNAAIAALTVFSATSPIVQSLFTPTDFELTLMSGTLSNFNTLDDYYQAQTQAGIMPYLDELKVRILTLGDSNQNSKAAKMQANYDFLSSKAKTLP